MIKIKDVLQNKRTLSFEFYPPKSCEGVPAVFRALNRLKVFNPDFVSVTYGAGGNTQVLTQEIVTRIKKETDLLAMAHMTCVGQTQEDIHQILSRLEHVGINNVIALRGDPPRGQSSFVPVAGGFSHAQELIEYIRRHFGFGIAAACYPEGHTESRDLNTDIEYTKRKLEAGAEFLITQLFYDNEYFYSFVDRARRVGIEVPILAGVLPILSRDQILRFTSLCGATIPAKLRQRLDDLGDDSKAVRELGIQISTSQVRDLWDNGVDGVHFYSLNRSFSIAKILTNLGSL